MDLFKNLAKAAFVAVALFGASVVLAPKSAQADDYTVTLTTHVPTESASAYTLGSYPNISGNLYVRDLYIANGGDQVQTISVYDTCTSSATATLAGTFVSATTGTTRIGELLPKVFQLSSPCFKKSSTGSTTDLTVLYQ